MADDDADERTQVPPTTEDAQHSHPARTGDDRRLKDNLDTDTRRQIGRKGGAAVSQDRSHMAEIGRRGGQAVSRDPQHMADIGRRGGAAVSRDRAHMAAIGRRGGAARGAHKAEDAMPTAPETSRTRPPPTAQPERQAAEVAVGQESEEAEE